MRRSLLRPLLRRLALLEHALTTSRPFVILERALSIPPTLPFLLSLGFLFAQARKFWRTQREAFVMAVVMAAQVRGTVRCLADVEATLAEDEEQQGEDAWVDTKRKRRKQREAYRAAQTQLQRQSVRWLSYWTLFALFSFFETVRLSPHPLSALDLQAHASGPGLIARLQETLAPFIRWLAPRLPERLRPSLAPPARRPFREPQPFLVSTAAGNNPRTGPVISAAPLSPRLPLPEAIFGPQSLLYLALKVVFLNWASSERSRGAERLWDLFLRPFVGTSVSPDETSTEAILRRGKLNVFVLPEGATPKHERQGRPPWSTASSGSSSREHSRARAPSRAPNTTAASPPTSPPMSAARPLHLGDNLARRAHSAPLPSAVQTLSSSAGLLGQDVIHEEASLRHHDTTGSIPDWGGEGTGHWDSLRESEMGSKSDFRSLPREVQA